MEHVFLRQKGTYFFPLSTNAIYFQNPILVVISLFRNNRFILDELTQQNDTNKYRHVFLFFFSFCASKFFHKNNGLIFNRRSMWVSIFQDYR